MKRHLLVAAGLSMFALAGARAQDLTSPVCDPGTSALDPKRIAQDACQQAYDVYQFMAPQLGLALAGGNATLGQASTLGGFGHFSIGARINGFQGSLPQVQNFQQNTGGARQNPALQTKDQWLGLPTADAAIGIFGGLPVGLTNIGGIDALVSASYVPNISRDSVSITPSSNYQIGYGIRVGLISESIIVPGVSFTYLKRDLPTTTIVGKTNSGTTSAASLKIDQLKVATTAMRLVASKSLLLFSFAGGVGRDTYDQSADISATVSTSLGGLGSATSQVPNTKQKLDRTNVFFDAALNLPLFKIVGEVGQVTGGTIKTYNGFSGRRADDSQPYFSLGVRLGI